MTENALGAQAPIKRIADLLPNVAVGSERLERRREPLSRKDRASAGTAFAYVAIYSARKCPDARRRTLVSREVRPFLDRTGCCDSLMAWKFSKE
ncbi:hypothetical protein PMAYCL1PPCAC_07670, partial [Pristionchus mayeri]